MQMCVSFIIQVCHSYGFMVCFIIYSLKSFFGVEKLVDGITRPVVIRPLRVDVEV